MPIFDEKVKSFFASNASFDNGDVSVLGEMFPNKRLYFHSYIEGYCLSIKALYNTITDESIPPVYRDNMSYPFMFLCRQVIELWLKKCMLLLGEDYKRNHQLNDLYNDLGNRLNHVIESDLLITGYKNIGLYVTAICELDSDSMHLRYPESKKGKIHYHSFPRRNAVKIDDLFRCHSKFCDQMNGIEKHLEDNILIVYSNLINPELVETVP